MIEFEMAANFPVGYPTPSPGQRIPCLIYKKTKAQPVFFRNSLGV